MGTIKVDISYIIALFAIVNGIIATDEMNIVDPGERLFLTPLIKAGKIEEAVEKSKVVDFGNGVISYSGFITVNEETNSNIFFWFVPSIATEDNAAVILWNDGGPGISAFMSIFSQNGPFTGNSAGDGYTMNPHSWHKKHHMIYMDNPVDVGFSFTDKEEGYINSSAGAARDIYEFLTQFFTLFPHLRQNPFYNAGASYGSTYAIETANYIHQKNLGEPEVHMNLTGIILDSPWIESYSQMDYGDILYTAGLINEKSRTHFNEKQKQMKDLIDQEKYEEGFGLWVQLTVLDTVNLTGYPAINNILNDIPVFTDMTTLAVDNATRKAIHVGPQRFLMVSPDQQKRMHSAMLHTVKPQLDTILKAGYRCLIYVGNMDCSTGHIGVERVLKSLTWESAHELIDGPRTIWKVKDGIAGYVTKAGEQQQTATFVIVRNAGHGVLLDQPERVLQAVNNYIFGEEDWKAVK